MSKETTLRKALSKKTRFDVFKRDAFACQYCGSTPPTVVLEVDHILPVSKNGTNAIDNLITSCFDCNRGKRDVELNVLPEKTIEKIELTIEKEEQYRQYQKLLKSIEKRLHKEIEKIDELYTSYFPDYCLNNGFKNTSVRKFITLLGFNEVYSSMESACAKIAYYDRAPKYFCGICWSKIREVQDGK